MWQQQCCVCWRDMPPISEASVSFIARVGQRLCCVCRQGLGQEQSRNIYRLATLMRSVHRLASQVHRLATLMRSVHRLASQVHRLATLMRSVYRLASQVHRLAALVRNAFEHALRAFQSRGVGAGAGAASARVPSAPFAVKCEMRTLASGARA